MKKLLIIVAISIQASLLSGCATAWQNVSYSDDLYSVHNKIAIANRQKAEAELAKAQYEAQQAQYEATLAKIKAEAAQKGITISDDAAFNAYEGVLADSYESAYARRLYGFSSPTYRMPSSYYTWRYSDTFFYASAYDPAFYNIVISGDMVWVEPKYVTSMFGSWGAAVIPSYSWYYGWNDPFYYWNRPYRYSWYYGWNNPYYWGWGYPYNYYYGHHYHHHYPHRPPYHRPPHHRPPYAGSGSVGNTGHHHNRPGATVGRNPGASKPVDRSVGVRQTKPSTGRATQPTYRGSSSSSSSRYNGSSSYRSNTGSSSYRSGSSSSSSSSSRSYSAPSSRSYSAPSSSSGGSSYSGGGNSRGR